MVKPRKLKMEMRETLKERSVSFTKRRQGLFSKAADFSVITDAQIALWVTSPCANGKTYSFSSHHSIDQILDAFVQGRIPKPVNNAAKIYVMSLWHEINALESYNSSPLTENNESATQGHHWNLEEFENCNSVEVLKDIVDRLESMRSELITRLNKRAISQALPSNSCPPTTIDDVCSVQPIGIVGGESSTSGINYDTMPSSSMSTFGFSQNVSDMNYNIHDNHIDVLFPYGFNQEDNVGDWCSNNNLNVALGQMQNEELFDDQSYQNTKLEYEDEKIFAGLGSELGDFMDNKFNDVGRMMGSSWMWNRETDEYENKLDESIWKNYDGEPINDEWFCFPPLG